ncbi:MAG: hypothetical protein HEQ27_14385 [Dolichospermum sp. JUN01]|nr:hypothetical protein [Dolichospermum sp. JUN01]
MKGEAYVGIYQKPIAATISSSLIPEQLESEDSKELSVICCPETHESLQLADDDIIIFLNQMLAKKELTSDDNKRIEAALIRFDRTAIYPIKEGIPILLAAKVIVNL